MANAAREQRFWLTCCDVSERTLSSEHATAAESGKPTGLASRFDNGNPHGFSGFCEAKFEQIGTGEGQRQPLLFVSIDQKAYLRPPCAKSSGWRPILTKVGLFPLGCPDTLVWGARAAKFPRDRLRCPTRWLGRSEPNLALIGGVFGPTRVHVENADHT